MTYRDEFDEPPRGNGFLGNVGPKAAFFVVLIALSFMIGVVWKLYVGASNNPNEAQVPIVRADTEPFKVSPDEPGGMDIPHKDSTLFSSLSGGNEDSGKIENLLADDENEDPMPRSQLFAGLNTEKSADLHAEAQDTPLDKPVSDDAQRILEQAKEAKEIVGNMIDEGVESVVPPAPKAIREGTITDVETKAVMKLEETETPVVSEPVTAAPKVEPKVEVKLEPVPAPKPVVTEKPAAKVERTATATPASGDYYVQLASVKSREAAEAEWSKLQNKYTPALSGYSHRVEMADLGAKGIFYRIQAGPVSKDAASKACAEIKKINPSGCLVKKK